MSSIHDPIEPNSSVLDPLKNPLQQAYSEKISAADNSTTFLEYSRVMKGATILEAAKALGVSEDRYRALESATANSITTRERFALQRFAPGLSADQLLSPVTIENKAQFLAGRF